MKRTLTLVAMALALASLRLPAQQAAGTATIVFADGSNLTVVRGPREIPLKEPSGEILEPGDYLQTGKRTSVEIVTLPRKSVLRVAENTTFRYLGSGEDGVWGIELLYGRVRVRAEGPGTYEVRASSTSAKAVGADFGMDIVVTRGQGGMQGRSEVYCFEGSVTVSPGKSQDASGAAPLALKPGTAAESSIEGGRLVISQSSLETEKKSFWSEHDFRSEYAGLIILPKGVSSAPGTPELAAVPSPAPTPAPVFRAAVVPPAATPASSDGALDLVDITPSASAAPAVTANAVVTEAPKEVPVPPVEKQEPPPAAPAVAAAPPPMAPPTAPAPPTTEVKAAEPLTATAAPTTAPAAPNLDWNKYRLQVVGKNILIGAGSLIVAGGLGLEAWAAYRLNGNPTDPASNEILVAGISTSVVGAVIGVIGLLANPRSPSR